MRNSLKRLIRIFTGKDEVSDIHKQRVGATVNEITSKAQESSRLAKDVSTSARAMADASTCCATCVSCSRSIVSSPTAVRSH